MDIFSLIDKGLHEEGDAEFSMDDDGIGGFETPRSTESLATPRSLFSTPPRTPRTPPRPTSHVDDRIRMRKYKLAMSPCPSPRASPSKARSSSGGDLLSESLDDAPLCHRVTDISFSNSSSGGGDSDEWNGSNQSYSYSPNVTPNNSPRRSDLLSLSPIQKRLERARTKRQQILEERVQNIDVKTKEKEQSASKRKEDATLEKVSKARTAESITQAKTKRQQIHDERVQQIEEKSKLKEEEATKRKENVTSEKVEKAKSELAKSPIAKERREQLLALRVESIEAMLESKREASKRKEDVTMEKVEKARSELAKPEIAKERRDQQLALRVESIEATLESKTEQAQLRLERHLLEKQQRASCQERKERAERRRKLISYEKRAKLLAALDAKLERAALNSHKYNEEKATKAGEDIVKAKEVARRVKAARSIQSAARDAYGFESSDTGETVDLSHHEAARRLQRWLDWRARVCETRLLANEDSDGAPEAVKALEQLLEIFSATSKIHQAQQFEMLSCKMMQPDTLKMAAIITSCLRPINVAGSSSSHMNIDARTFLSLLLIALHPEEVLGEDFVKPIDELDDVRSGKGCRLLAEATQSLLQSLGDLVMSNYFKPSRDIDAIPLKPSFSKAGKFLLKASALFQWWKMTDLEQLLAGLSKQLEQSWVVYLSSSETLKYLTDVTGVAAPPSSSISVDATASSSVVGNRDDPLMSLRLRHEAGRNGSRSHIKRIRASLNKLIGSEEGKEVVRSAKMIALEEIEATGATRVLKQEIDEIHGGRGPSAATAGSFEGDSSIAENESSSETVQVSVGLPDEILANRTLVHRILLTDPSDFDKLSWDGTDAQTPNISPEEFMASFLPQTESYGIGSVQEMPNRLATSMRRAFFDQVVRELGQGNFEPIRELLKELHAKMRSLLPSRKDLHSHINDEDIASCSTTADLLRMLIRSGYLLANFLESAARAPSTRELIGLIETFSSEPRGGEEPSVPFGIESGEMFAVASTAYILHKAEVCQMDISNFKLSQAAPLVHHVGHEYERKHFIKTFGDYGSSTVDELKHMLPSTWNWVETMPSLYADSENITAQSNLDQKMDFVKGKGFVDAVLFTRSQIALPEFLSMDVESISRIRSEARCCVIASALVLHACNISRVGSSALSSSVMSDEVNSARQALSSILRKRHFRQDELEASVIDAVNGLTKALAERDLSEDELIGLKNHTLAVLHGNDPVLKLLDNRVQSFFRFACKWKPDASQPLEMKTGRSVLKTDNDIGPRHGLRSTKEEFASAAKKEASRLGFAYFALDLIDVGNLARSIISLACANYGKDILDPFLGAVCQG